MDIKEKLDLIRRNTQEIVTEEELEELLKTKKKPAVYLGTAITGRPHVAYFAWVIKLADFHIKFFSPEWPAVDVAASGTILVE